MKFMRSIKYSVIIILSALSPWAYIKDFRKSYPNSYLIHTIHPYLFNSP